MPTNTGSIDYYNINFEEIERQVNKKVHSGENITDAINEAFDFIVYEQDVTKHPTALFVSDAFGANGDQVVLYARLMSLDKPSGNRTVVFEMDDNAIGQAITDANGNVSLNYTIPDGVDIGVHQISAVFSGDDTYNGTRGYALLNVLNQPPKVILELPGVMLSGTVLVNGTVTDTNLEQVMLEIDSVIAADSIPYLWDTTNYTGGLHTVKLIGMDSYGEKGQSMAFVIVDNTLPTITNVSAISITPNSATITWDTDEPSDSIVKYGTESGNYTMQKYDPENVTAHRITLTGLLPNTTYYYVVNSTDPSGNTNESSEHYFNTTGMMCGDVNCDGAADMSDVIDLLYYVGYPGQYTICSEWSADVNCDGHRDMSDVRALLYYVGYPEHYALKCCYKIND
jgi:hypothetical protein